MVSFRAPKLPCLCIGLVISAGFVVSSSFSSSVSTPVVSVVFRHSLLRLTCAGCFIAFFAFFVFGHVCVLNNSIVVILLLILKISSRALSSILVTVVFLRSPLSFRFNVLGLVLVRRTEWVIYSQEVRVAVKLSPVPPLWLVCFDTVLFSAITFPISCFTVFRLWGVCSLSVLWVKAPV